MKIHIKKKKLILLTFLLIAILSFFIVGQANWHKNRNQHNQLPAGNLKKVEGNFYEDEKGLSWELQPHIKNKFHQPDHEVAAPKNPYPNVEGEIIFDSKNPNLKFLSKGPKGDSYEVILQPDGSYLTEGVKQGTYNYGHPEGLWGYLKHALLDVIPHFSNSNYKTQ